MNTQEPRNPLHGGVTDPLAVTSPDTLLDSPSAVNVRELERQVEYIVDECFFTVGQVVGMRTTVDRIKRAAEQAG